MEVSNCKWVECEWEKEMEKIALGEGEVQCYCKYC